MVGSHEAPSLKVDPSKNDSLFLDFANDDDYTPILDVDPTMESPLPQETPKIMTNYSFSSTQRTSLQ